jgi:hypothetical protein
MAKKPFIILSFYLAGLLLQLTPQPARADAINDCLIIAAKAQYQLDPTIWSRLLVVRYSANQLQHVYLVYTTKEGDLLSFDNTFGTRRFRTASRNPSELARIVDPRASWGWYVEENTNNRTLLAQVP